MKLAAYRVTDAFACGGRRRGGRIGIAPVVRDAEERRSVVGGRVGDPGDERRVAEPFEEGAVRGRPIFLERRRQVGGEIGGCGDGDFALRRVAGVDHLVKLHGAEPIGHVQRCLPVRLDRADRDHDERSIKSPRRES